MQVLDALTDCTGGDQSLVISNELPEDDPHAGEADLRALVAGCDRVLFVGTCVCPLFISAHPFPGITCGLSAPYVAGQIAYSMQQPNFTTVLMGFNPVSLARNAPVENWDATCFSVCLVHRVVLAL
jgi:N-acetylmuramic acid 6-phosphate (MurNAc-6-P) etherase